MPGREKPKLLDERLKARISEQIQRMGARGQPTEEPRREPATKQYLAQRHIVEQELESALRECPKIIRKFFARFWRVDSLKASRRTRFLLKIADEHEPAFLALDRYITFALRFNVRLRLHRNPPHFRVVTSPLSGTRFHGCTLESLEDNLAPWTASDIEGEFVEYEHPDLPLPEGVEEMIACSKSAWLQIDDADTNSLLAQIEDVVYDPERVSFVFHNANSPFLFCLIGENVGDEAWREAGKIKNRFQQQMFGTGKRGKRPNLNKRAAEYNALGTPSQAKSKAVDLLNGKGTERELESKLRELRRRKSELKSRPSKPAPGENENPADTPGTGSQE